MISMTQIVDENECCDVEDEELVIVSLVMPLYVFLH